MARVSYSLIWLIFFVASMQGSSAISRHPVSSTTTSKTGFVHEKIPRECEELGYCEVSKRHPEELATKLVRELKEARVPLDSDINEAIPAINFRGGFRREATCNFTTQTIKPLMIRDVTDGKWYYTVNTKKEPIQIYNVQKCTKSSPGEPAAECSNQIILNDDYDSRCIQKYIIRKVQVVKNNKPYPISGRIPCCCSCVAVNRYQ